MRQYNNRYNGPATIERVVCAASYLSMGFIGFIWLIISALMGKRPSQYARYHVYQSIFISILVYIISLVGGILLSIVKFIPFIGGLVLSLVFWLTQAPLVLNSFSIVHFVLTITILYLAIDSFRGKFTQLPWISDMVRQLGI